jgi:hypothetical protein
MFDVTQDQVQDEELEGSSFENEILDGLMEHMESEELAERFHTFAMHAAIDPDMLEADDEEIPEEGCGYWVVASKSLMPVNGREMLGIHVAIWPDTLAPEGEFLPLHLSRARHARFLEVDPESELICEMHEIPTLH